MRARFQFAQMGNNMQKREFGENDKIVSITLDPSTITPINPDEIHERKAAIFDLIEENKFYPARVKADGPYALHLSIIGNYLLLDVRNPTDFSPISAHYLSLTPFRGLIRDYFRVREHYFEAIKSAQIYQIEAVDMGRRGLHNEAAEILRTRLKNKLEMDHQTARRLFTLICAVQPLAERTSEEESGLPTCLFVCSMNSVRSPIAAALARRHFSTRLIARSAGAFSGKADGFVHQIMQEIGIDMSVHTPHRLSELVASKFDIIITLSNRAKEAVNNSKLEAGRIEHWQVSDPTKYEGTRENKLAHYRQLRDELDLLVKTKLPTIFKGGSQSV